MRSKLQSPAGLWPDGAITAGTVCDWEEQTERRVTEGSHVLELQLGRANLSVSLP